MLNPGDKLSHYNIISAIGAGGMGEVYLAEDTRLDRQIALKVLIDEVANDEDRVRRFVQEAKASSALNHPNILTIYEIGEYKNSRYIATEFIKGKTLRDRVNTEPLTLRESLEVILQVAAALGAAHEAGIIHRDIKPENIMIRDDSLVKVLDFGLAKLWGPANGSQATTLPQMNTHPGMLVGTVAYMSPEQARGRKLDPRSDIFSLGILMFELFTGQRPFSGDGHLDLISSILKDEAPTLRQISPDMPRQLERIVEKSLRKDRNHRYQHVRDLYIDIEDLRDEMKLEVSQSKLLETRGAAAALATNPGDARTKLTASISKTRRFTLLHAIIFAFVAVGIVAAVWYFRPGPLAGPVPGSYKVTEVATWNSAPGELFSNASFSPDGKLIAFSSTKSGTKNIWVTQTGSTEAIQITRDEFANLDPIWSPNGDEIAYFSDRNISSSGEVNLTGFWRVSALGGTPKLIAKMPDKRVQMRRWTRSGNLYFQLSNELYALNMSSGNSQKITAFDDPNITWINISPEENSVAYATKAEDNWHIYVTDLSAKKTVEAASGTGEIENVAWLPEKNRVVYSAPLNGILQIYSKEISSEPARQITSGDTNRSVVDVNVDGTSIITSAYKHESSLWRISLMDGQESPLSRDLNTKLWPSVSADDEKVAFQAAQDLNGGDSVFNSEILVTPIKNSDENQRRSISSGGFLPSWAPDNSEIAFLRMNGEIAELYGVNPHGGGEYILSRGPILLGGYSTSPYNYTQANAYAWSPDGAQIAFPSNRDQVSNIWILRLNDRFEQAVTSNVDRSAIFACPVWSVDGQRIAFYFQKTDENKIMTRGLRILDTVTHDVKTVLETSKFIHLIGWTQDEKGLLFAESENFSSLPPETFLKRIDPEGEKLIEKVHNIYFYNIFSSFDRKYIAYAARSSNKDDVWVKLASGGVSRKVTNNNDPGLYVSRLAWLHDGSAIVFAKQTRFCLLSLISNFDQN